MKVFNSIFSRIVVAIVLTAGVTIGIIGLVIKKQINEGFDTFLHRQADEVYGGAGWGRLQTDEQRLQRLNQLTGEFEKTVNTSIVYASLSGFMLALASGLIVSKQITKPLGTLKQKIKLLSKNNYKILNEGNKSSEIEALIKEFNSLVKELNRVEQLRENLVSDVTHELKTPLTKILGQLEGCLDGVYDCSEERIKKVIGNVNQLEDLISQLQKLVEIRAHKVKLNKKKIKLKPFIEGIKEGYIDQKVPLDINIQKGAIVHADKNRLREIIDNLLSNAFRYTSKGRVAVSYKNDKLIIADTGIGISKKDLPYIFERFYRTDKSRNSKTGGLGLGLSIVKELVMLHGWDINIQSNLGKGTTFTISV